MNKTHLTKLIALVLIVLSHSAYTQELQIRDPFGSRFKENEHLHLNQPFKVISPTPINKDDEPFLIINDFPFKVYKPINDYKEGSKELIFMLGLSKIKSKPEDIVVSGNTEPDIIDWLQMKGDLPEFNNLEQNIYKIQLSSKDGTFYGTYDVNSLPKNPEMVPLKFIVEGYRSWGALILFILLTIILLCIMAKAGFMQEAKPISQQTDNEDDKRQASLRMFVLCFWTSLVISMLVYCWAISRVMPALNSSTLILMGIVIVVAVTGSTESSANKPIYPPSDKKTLIGKVTKRFLNWIKTICSGSKGVEISRFQNLLFTLIFGSAFILYGLFHFKFMSFTTIQLGLMGISSAGYLGLKWAKES